jgi:phosphohistidine phosphatase
MRYLLIMRHAKSDWGSGSGRDHDRPLNPRGIGAARSMGSFITEAGLVPDLAVASTAVRALTTAELAHEAGEWRCPLRSVSRLYASTPGTVLGVIQELPDEAGRLLVVGHEPTSSALVAGLIGGGQLRFPTAAVACIAFDGTSWRHLAPGRGELAWLMAPRLLASR